MTAYTLIDLSGLWWTSWFGTTGDARAALDRVTRVLNEESAKCDRMAIALDSKGCFRQSRLAPLGIEYKGNRPEKDEMAVKQLGAIKASLRESDWPVFEAEGYEADDVLASLALQLATGTDAKVLILSADKDQLQCVSPTEGVHVADWRGRVYSDVASVQEKMGVNPTQVPDYLALVGDKADNIPGIDNVGPKRAAGLLTKYGDLHTLRSRLNDPGVDLPDQVWVANLKAGIDRAILIADQVTTLVTDIELDAEQMRRLTEGAKPSAPKEIPMVKREVTPAQQVKANGLTFNFSSADEGEDKLRMAITGPSGSGKTFTALSLAFGLGERVAVLDTEHGSARKHRRDMRAKFGREFFSAPLEDHSPESYVAGIKAAEQAGFDVIVIDSLSHAWMGKNGALELADKASQKYRGNSFSGWKDVRPKERALLEAILGSSAHIIATMRVKTAYEVETSDKGKRAPKKIGLAPVQKDGIEYEFDIVGEMTPEHTMVVGITRCTALDGAVIPKPGAELAAQLDSWLKGAA